MREILEKTVEHALKLGSEYADIRVERVATREITACKGIIEKAVSGVDAGAAMRVLVNGAWGYASTSTLNLNDLKASIEKAVKMARANSEKLPKAERVKLAEVKTVEDTVKIRVKKSLNAMDISEKISFILEVDEIIRSYSPKIVSTDIRYGDIVGKKILLTSEGTYIVMDVSRAYISMTAIAKEGARIQSYRTRIGGKGGFEKIEREDPLGEAKRAASKAVEMLKAKPAPSGRFTVIADPFHIGVFAHEALGHACEADLVTSGQSVVAGKLGEQIGSEVVTIYDDSTVDFWGSEKYDDEGVPTRKRVLIENGVLKEYITSRESAAKLGVEPNGGGRAMNYNYAPIVRMSNTYVAPGDYSFEELIEDIKYGIYVKDSRGGQVDPAMGTFQFNAQEAYLIENGEITTPLLDVSLSGLTLETLKNIDAVGKDLKLSIGFCGKGGQYVPVGTGGPHVRIKEVVVGGMR